MTSRACPSQGHSRAWARRSLVLMLCLSACTLQRGGAAQLTDPLQQADDTVDADRVGADADSVDAPPNSMPPDVMDEGETGLDAGLHAWPGTTVPRPPEDDAWVIDDPDDEEPDSVALCPGDAGKIEPGQCGCDLPDTDKDGDSVADCHDACPKDRNKQAPGFCGCGEREDDRDHDDVPDCIDACPRDALKAEPGACGCGKAETDRDGDGVVDCKRPWFEDRNGRRH